MAKFTEWVDMPGKRRYNRLRGTPSYQDWAHDPGNYNSGVVGDGELIGTNRSISAPVLSAWRGYPVTRQQMLDLGIDEARQIYKAKYWDKIQGDKINSQVIAEMTADFRSHTGNSKILQRALNNLGAGLVVDGGVGTATLTALNDLLKRKGEQAVYDQMRIEAIRFYDSLSYRFAGEAGVRHLNQDYPPYEQLSADRKGDTGGGRRWWIWLAVVMVVLAVGAWLAYRYRRKLSAWWSGGAAAAVVAALIIVPIIPPL